MYSCGKNTLKINYQLHKENRERLCKALKEFNTEFTDAIILLKGGVGAFKYDTDVEYIFQQESFFHWTFGVLEPDFWGTIDIKNGKTRLFSPKLPDEFEIWMGKLLSSKDYKSKYLVDEVLYIDDEGFNSDSDNYLNAPNLPILSKFTTNTDVLHSVMTECRLIKSSGELEILKYVAKLSCEAHKEVMKNIVEGMMEYELEGIFQRYVLNNGGARVLAYTPICACGPSSATLHYGSSAQDGNWRQLRSGDLFLTDMGASYYGYASDITITCPVPSQNARTAGQVKYFEGKSAEMAQKGIQIYNAVLEANRNVLKAAKSGVSWFDMHLLAERTILKTLLELGFLKGGNIDELLQNRVGAIFMPHGVGHFLGLDVHDVGGYPKGELKSVEPGLKSLRTKRTLREGMVLTIEPGCYFIPSVRIEDEIYIGKDGAELLTDYLPRTIADIENFMSQYNIQEDDKNILKNGH